MSGKGSQLRKGLNLDKYRDEHDRIFSKPQKKESNEKRDNRNKMRKKL